MAMLVYQRVQLLRVHALCSSSLRSTAKVLTTHSESQRRAAQHLSSPQNGQPVSPFSNNMGGNPKIGVGLQNGWFIMKNPIKMDDLGGTTIFGNIHILSDTVDG